MRTKVVLGEGVSKYQVPPYLGYHSAKGPHSA
jgi:hypothetical protein